MPPSQYFDYDPYLDERRRDGNDDFEHLVTCKYCGSNDVYWVYKRGTWWLENYTDGSKHHCISQQAVLDDFEDLTK